MTFYRLRNNVMTALEDILKTMDTVQTVTRRFAEFTGPSMSAQFPYLMLTKPKEVYPPRAISSLPPKRTFKIDITIYLAFGLDQQGVPDDQLNDILDELDWVLRPPPGSPTLTLGGLVDYCYISGDVICVPGDLDGIGMIVVPIEIIVP